MNRERKLHNGMQPASPGYPCGRRRCVPLHRLRISLDGQPSEATTVIQPCEESNDDLSRTGVRVRRPRYPGGRLDAGARCVPPSVPAVAAPPVLALATPSGAMTKPQAKNGAALFRVGLQVAPWLWHAVMWIWHHFRSGGS